MLPEVADLYGVPPAPLLSQPGLSGAGPAKVGLGALDDDRVVIVVSRPNQTDDGLRISDHVGLLVTLSI